MSTGFRVFRLDPHEEEEIWVESNIVIGVWGGTEGEDEGGGGVSVTAMIIVCCGCPTYWLKLSNMEKDSPI